MKQWAERSRRCVYEFSHYRSPRRIGSGGGRRSSMHSSQNEQDSRVYGKFAMILFWTFQPAGDIRYCPLRVRFIGRGETSVLLRIPTRLSHSRAVVSGGEAMPQNQLAPTQEKNRWILLPVNARKGYHRLLEKQAQLINFSEFSRFNQVISGNG